MRSQERRSVMFDCMDDRLVTFSNQATWQLKRKLTEKPWEGSVTRDDPDWQPSEVHSVYECVQLEGPNVGTFAIMKIRIEVPHESPPDRDPDERAKCASGMRLNVYTAQEIESLQRLTAANCSVAPTLLAVKIDAQDESILNGKEGTEFRSHWGDVKWWMPGGYIVFILMTKLPGESLERYWDPKLFGAEERLAIRTSFRKALIEVSKIGIQFNDTKLQNILWDKREQKCYLIDYEDTEYCADLPNSELFVDYDYYEWGLKRTWAEPGW